MFYFIFHYNADILFLKYFFGNILIKGATLRFEFMLPYQIKEAIAKNIPIVLPIGVLEYHGEHMAVGMDTLAVTKILDRLESQMEVVILPPFSYGACKLCCSSSRTKWYFAC